MKFILTFFVVSISFINLRAQIIDSIEISKQLIDSLYIVEVQDKMGVKDKVLHAEPLYIDLIRDLGARKGEKEWNIGLGMIDNNKYDGYEALIEYEFAPIDRLGFEVELPFSFYYSGTSGTEKPSSKLNSLKLATQWSFFVSEKLKTTMALGYLHEFEMTNFNNYGKSDLFIGNIYNPFFVIAKRWGQNFHTLIYAGSKIEQHFQGNNLSVSHEINTNFHYMIPGTRNFIGVEVNKEFINDEFEVTFRPQIRVEITDNLLIGIVTGIPVNKKNERLSSFVRLIYEPKHKFVQDKH
jgi:hypothetical protein